MFARSYRSIVLFAFTFFSLSHAWVNAAAPDTSAADYEREIRPLLAAYCNDCHGEEVAEADVNLTSFATIADIQHKPRVWQKVDEMLRGDQMPPVDADQPTDAERAKLKEWVHTFLKREAEAHAGDPGPVVLRRLNNAEYTYTIRDLTGVDSLDPAKEFPVDGASGEGFTNVGNSLVMSPSLLTKYLDAAKQVAAHAVLLPSGITFSPYQTHRDWTDEWLQRIRGFYSQYTEEGGGLAVNLQGIQFDTNKGGRLPLEKYIAATVEEREALASGATSIDDVAKKRGLSAKYLNMAWDEMNKPTSTPPAVPFDLVRERWRSATPEQVHELCLSVIQWQQVLWKFNPVGHIGKANGPKHWMEGVPRTAHRQDLRLDLAPAGDSKEVVVFLSSNDAADGNDQDVVVWHQPRLTAPGKPDILLRDLRLLTNRLMAVRSRSLPKTAEYLVAVEQLRDASNTAKIADVAAMRGLEEPMLNAWLDYLGIGDGSAVQISGMIDQKVSGVGGYEFINGWGYPGTPSIVANSSDQSVRIPGSMRPNGVAMHPAPDRNIVVGWSSPVRGAVTVEATVTHIHPECGNGVEWFLEVRRGATRQRLAQGVAHGSNTVTVGPVQNVSVKPGDLVSLLIGPRNGDHSCDLTDVDLVIKGEHEWRLTHDVTPDIQAANPHKDSFGNASVWNFYVEPIAGDVAGPAIPAGSLLDQWLTAPADAKAELAKKVQQVLTGETPAAKDSPDAVLFAQLTSLGGPLLGGSRAVESAADVEGADSSNGSFGLDPNLFGKLPDGTPIDPNSIAVAAPTTLEVHIPTELAAGRSLLTAATLDERTGREGSVQVQVAASPLAEHALLPGLPIIVNQGSQANQRIDDSLGELRHLFPPALCYTKIVPVDEVVTMVLFFREDNLLSELMLTEEESATLDRYWDEMLYAGQAPLLQVNALDQLREFATQDRQDLVPEFDAVRKRVYKEADAYRQRLVENEPVQLDAVLAFADGAYRHPLTEEETNQLRSLYQTLREEEIPHDEAIRLTLARILVSPTFLYRTETPGPGTEAAAVNDWELATRLSYFLWSSVPDEELYRCAAEGKLHDPDVLAAQMMRMLSSPKTRRLATEFMCQWLHIYNFDQLDEKSEQTFPDFPEVRGAMYEEAIQFFTDLFQHNRSVLNLLDADYAFVNDTLAKYYGIPNVTGSDWQRVDHAGKFSRGGILTFASTMAKQSGASRTSPILRGNWISEVVLGEALPRPPKNVPVLSDEVPQGLTERQLIERHSTDPACAKCHARIDPFGFALESFDAVGRFREKDVNGLAIDTKTTLPDGTKIEGLGGLQNYLLNTRRDAFVRQFCRKLLGYALGRSIQLSDEPLLDEMDSALKANNYSVVSAMETVVRSRQFREIRGRDRAYEE